ncbi:hypothetical protein AOC05_04870 [Arthrobacter alpinus]|uniref:Uncharacterized protein n=1 Tax=Arthrobacter alpinus TaxID=656366 RepID=A0A0M5LX53_9MICC|nr:hypothetical protein AOC05_04870 [Arthrobacter alpinus]
MVQILGPAESTQTDPLATGTIEEMVVVFGVYAEGFAAMLSTLPEGNGFGRAGQPVVTDSPHPTMDVFRSQSKQ